MPKCSQLTALKTKTAAKFLTRDYCLSLNLAKLFCLAEVMRQLCFEESDILTTLTFTSLKVELNVFSRKRTVCMNPSQRQAVVYFYDTELNCRVTSFADHYS